MTASTRVLAAYRPRGWAAWVVPFALVAGLAVAVSARLVATRAALDGIAVGAAFGLALVGVSAWPARSRLVGQVRSLVRRPHSSQLAIAAAAGVAFGLALVGLAVLGPALAGVSTAPGIGRPAAPFLSWVGATILVATAEEVLLRGVLLDRIQRAGGLVPAVLLTSAVFALMHVPLYGWHVVPLDFAVGLGLAGVRLTTRGLIAPVVAHSVADLATWWL